MPRRARWLAIGARWTAVSISLVATAAADRLHPAFGVTLFAAAVTGTWVILRFRRAPGAQTVSAGRLAPVIAGR